ncbi:unnamed protein product [Linum tenue]|uniref:GDSL esterase/lipase n=1 Tax=Linum tenue TaxID=586396 RepID=A0AAV0LJH7_9ROSI|nr:unnamed protein product [Linum tenue]
MAVPATVTMLLIVAAVLPIVVIRTAEARAFFVFGDSLVDSGNNNYLATTARADSPPYGVDYPTRRPTGRFSNGLNIPDLISERIGQSEPPLPYLSPELTGRRLLNGANFASAGIGVLNDTERAMRGTNGGCSAELQRAAALFNPQLDEVLSELNREIGRDVFVGVNTAQMHNDFVTNPGAFGFATSKVACCGQGPYNGLGLCTPASNLCPNRNLYAFWDAFHPSEKANRIIVEQMFSGTAEYMKPMNLTTILQLDART